MTGERPVRQENAQLSAGIEQTLIYYIMYLSIV